MEGSSAALTVTPVPTLPSTALSPVHTSSCASVGEGEHVEYGPTLGCMHELVIKRIQDPYRASVTEKSWKKRAVLVDNPDPQER